jgi:hypothetical protein
MEIKSNSEIPFLDVLVIRNLTTQAIKVYIKPAHAGRYLSTSNLTIRRM